MLLQCIDFFLNYKLPFNFYIPSPKFQHFFPKFQLPSIPIVHPPFQFFPNKFQLPLILTLHLPLHFNSSPLNANSPHFLLLTPLPIFSLGHQAHTRVTSDLGANRVIEETVEHSIRCPKKGAFDPQHFLSGH